MRRVIAIAFTGASLAGDDHRRPKPGVRGTHAGRAAAEGAQADAPKEAQGRRGADRCPDAACNPLNLNPGDRLPDLAAAPAKLADCRRLTTCLDYASELTREDPVQGSSKAA